ncbi:hypothetical protein [Bacillus paramycoides]|uniref:hypothetical protein n=1 Tax=Bacillus paramycoides TaxID=2026194 RepID=UPI002E1DC9BC|nr:hypothetical protein [Bacillus paramycoides]
MGLKFVYIEDGREQHLIHNNLIAVPGTGDIIEDPAPNGEKFKVESVVHQNVFNDPGEHSIIVNLIKL